MKGIVFLYLLLILSGLVSCTKKTHTSNSRNDSVEKYLKLAGIDTLPLETRKKHNQKAFSFIDLKKNDTVVRWYLGEVVYNSLNINDFDDYKIKNKPYLIKIHEAEDTLNLARYYSYKAWCLRKENVLDSSYYYFLKAEKFYNHLNRNEVLAMHYQKASIQHEFNDDLQSEYTLNLILKSKYGSKENKLTQRTLNLLGNVKHNLKDYYSAIESHMKALRISKKLNFQKGNETYSFEGTSLNNIGNSYRELKKYDSAIFYFKKALDKKILKNDLELESYLNNNLGYCYLKQNKLSQLPLLFEKAAKTFDSLNIKNEAAISRTYLSEYYAKIKDTLKAIEYSEKAVQLAKESKSSYYYLHALSNAGSINKKKAPEYIEEYHKLNDSLLFEERKARSQYFKIQLETDEITQEKEKVIKQKKAHTSVIYGVLFIVILLFIIYKQRSQKKNFC